MFKTPFSFEGRIRRKEYGFTMLIYIAFAFFLNLGVGALSTGYSTGAAIVGGLTLILYIPMLWFVFAQGAKRCHDLGRNGWWQIIPFYSLVLLFQDGVPETNEYGINPKADPSDNIIDSIGAE